MNLQHNQNHILSLYITFNSIFYSDNFPLGRLFPFVGTNLIALSTALYSFNKIDQQITKTGGEDLRNTIRELTTIIKR